MKDTPFRLKIIYTSDIHGNLLPINYSDNSPVEKGLLKLATAIRSLSKDPHLLIDLGDSIQGSPLMYFHQLNRDKYPNPMAQIYNELNYDYFIPGNHDFNYGQDYLCSFVDQMNATTLCQNIYTSDRLFFRQGYDLVTLENGLKILIVGVTTKYIPNWENPTYIADMTFKDPVDEVKRIVDQYRKDVDLVICGYHGGFEKNLQTGKPFVKDTGENQGYRLFHEIPGIDILLTGHQHRAIAEVFGKRAAMQPGGTGTYLGVVVIDFAADKTIDSVLPYLISAEGLKPDALGIEKIAKIEADNQIFLDQVIGEVKEGDLEITDMFRARRDKHPIVGFINDIQMQATGAMLSSTSLANVVSGFQKEITIRNVLSTYVYANTLTVVEIDGKTLRKYLERCAEYFCIDEGQIVPNPRFSYPKLEHYNYDMLDGIDYVFDLRKPFGERVISIKYQNADVKDDDQFTLALNNYRASGGGDFEMLKNLKVVKEIPFDVAELMIEYIRKQRYLHIKPKKNIILLK